MAFGSSEQEELEAQILAQTLDLRVEIQEQALSVLLLECESPREEELLETLKAMHSVVDLDGEVEVRRYFEDLVEMQRLTADDAFWALAETEVEDDLLRAVRILLAIMEWDEAMVSTLRAPRSMVEDRPLRYLH